MKKLLAALLILALFGVACDKEKDDDTKNDPYSNITVSNQQEAYVLLTTATWCGYCGSWGIPTFDEAFEGKDGIDKDRINGMALHYSSSDPMYHEMSKTLKDAFGIGGPPNLWIEFDNSYNLKPDGWKTAVKQRQAQPTATCGIGLAIERDGDNFKILTKVKFFESLSGTYNIAIYVAENGIVANQSGSSAGSNHVHMMTLRGELTANSAWGTQMFSGASPEEYKETFTYSPDINMKADNLKFVAVIYEMSGGKPISSPNSNTI